MTVETKIKDIDKQGVPEKILSDYKVHTISIVGEGALGMNLNKVKSDGNTKSFLKTEEGKALMSKVQKAKALEDQTEKPVEEATEQSEEVLQEDSTVEQDVEESSTEEVSEASEEQSNEDTDGVPEEPVEKVKSVEDTEEPEAEPEEAPESEPVDESVDSETDPVEDVVVEEEGEAVEKAKAYTSGELIQLQKDALDGVHSLVKKLKEAVPDADTWEVTDLVYSAIWKVEDAIYSAESSQWSEIYDEVYEEVNSRVQKSKALKVQESGDLETKLKALESIDPALAVLMKTQLAESKSKALEAEQENKAIIRAKALELGADMYKRIATDENTTDNIVDAMMKIEEGSPEAHAVISKALEVASNITMSGELFRDMGSSEEAIVLDEYEFVETKAKALVDANGGNFAAARATVRQSEEFITKFG